VVLSQKVRQRREGEIKEKRRKETISGKDKEGRWGMREEIDFAVFPGKRRVGGSPQDREKMLIRRGKGRRKQGPIQRSDSDIDGLMRRKGRDEFCRSGRLIGFNLPNL